MMDIVEKRGMEIDTHRLPELLGIPVIPVSARTDKSNHGMGIGLIEETALKYNGLMEITMNENLFCLSVLLYQN